MSYRNYSIHTNNGGTGTNSSNHSSTTTSNNNINRNSSTMNNTNTTTTTSNYYMALQLTERMKRKTIQRINNESKKDTARYASLEAADLVWLSCLERLASSRSSSIGSTFHPTTTTTSSRSLILTNPNNTNNNNTSSYRLGNSITNNNTTNTNTNNHHHDMLATKALGFPSSPTLVTTNNGIDKAPITIDYWSDDNDEDYNDDNDGDDNGNDDTANATRNNNNNNNNNNNTTTKDDIHPASSSDHPTRRIVPPPPRSGSSFTHRRSYIEDAAARGWNRGVLELNETLVVPSSTTTRTSSHSNNNNNNNRSNKTAIESHRLLYTTATGESITSFGIIDDDDGAEENETNSVRSRLTASISNYNNTKSISTITRGPQFTSRYQQGGRWTIRIPPIFPSRTGSKRLPPHHHTMSRRTNHRHRQRRFGGNRQQQSLSSTLSYHPNHHRGGSTTDANSTTNGITTPPPTSSDNNFEAWMCGVCGCAFSSEIAAVRHEYDHLEQIIYDMGYNNNNNNNTTSNYGTGGGGKQQQRDRYRSMTDDETEFNYTTNYDYLSDTSLPRKQSQQQQQSEALQAAPGRRRGGRRPTRSNSDSLDALITAALPVPASAAPVDSNYDRKRVIPDDIDATPLRSGSNGTRANSGGILVTTPPPPKSYGRSQQERQQQHQQEPIKKDPSYDQEQAVFGTDSMAMTVRRRHVAFSDDYDTMPGTVAPIFRQHPQNQPQPIVESTLEADYPALIKRPQEQNPTVGYGQQLTTHNVTNTNTHIGLRRRRNGAGNTTTLPNVPVTNTTIIPVEDEFPGLEADIPGLPADALIPRVRARSNSEVAAHLDSTNSEAATSFFYGDNLAPTTADSVDKEIDFMNDDGIITSLPSQQQVHYQPSAVNKDILLLSTEMRNHVIRADEALVAVVRQAEAFILNETERRAEYELALLAADKHYYDEIAARAVSRQIDPASRYRANNEKMLGKFQNKLLDAYQLMKDSDGKNGMYQDQYTKKRRKSTDGTESTTIVAHSSQTLFVNVMVKNSVDVVRHELQRLAKQRWETMDGTTTTTNNNNNATNHPNHKPGDATSLQGRPASNASKFERIRGLAQMNIVKLAGIALASDFTPRRIAVQLSNDLYRLLTPRLQRRGVSIETEIEYRVGPYFVLAINIKHIDWHRLIRTTYREITVRKARWKKEEEENQDNDAKTETKKHVTKRLFDSFHCVFTLNTFDILTKLFAGLYHTHWIIYLPVCWICYTLLGASIRQFIISSVTDEIFYYVEKKGMEMEIKICRADNQAPFMLSALREIRADGKELQKKQQETESQEKGQILGPYLGPAIKADQGPAAAPPPDFEVPPNLEFVGLEIDLPVGFRRLRWALLADKSKFMTELFFKFEAKYEKITLGQWDKFNDYIGEPTIPDTINMNDFIGAEKENEYLMPKSAFVSANMCYEKLHILAYNDHCFCVKKRARNPDAPFGNSFIAWTQMTVIDNGNDSCHLTCSVEPEFPNGPPMVSRQIRSGMRAGVTELFVLLAGTITKYADEYP